MKQTYFISDLHLSPERPDVAAAFIGVLIDAAQSAEAIYLIGDLFEYWIGDDAAELLGATEILGAMQQTAQHIPCYFIAGNRDFLVGEEFSKKTGFKILEDETIIDLYGKPTLILHGDSLCTDDIAHQQFRQAMVTNLEWRTQFLQLAIPERIEQAKLARTQSQEHKSSVSMGIMDVTESSVLKAFKERGVTQMIHGHTHRQNCHDYSVDSIELKRYVLGDWDKTSSVLIANKDELNIVNQAI